ncbi:MAG: helix-turn-helix domain-containing protein [Bryobacteraceae bacterium]|nr:helix-turn-helix domain-containing protein [Bryobacteraceae bacterium]
MTSTNLRAIREKRGISSAELAGQVGISRQTIYAIEAGTYVPNTTIALLLARSLEVPVEELFRLDDDGQSDAANSDADLLLCEPDSTWEGQGVRVGKVGQRRVAIPLTPEPAFLPDVDGIAGAARDGFHTILGASGREPAALVIAGCDPGLSLAASQLRGFGVALTSCSSTQALQWLREGRVHVAGSHLRDSATGEFNLPATRRLFPRGEFRVVTFATWEVGLVVSRGNPKAIRGVADLGRRGVTIVNREEGAGSREFLDRLILESGLEPKAIRGYDSVARGHLAAAARVASGDAHVCLATRVAARSLGLDFLPLAVERYDLITLNSYAANESVLALFEALNRAAVRRRLKDLAGYDTTETGVSR